jgi:hypothetical protein
MNSDEREQHKEDCVKKALVEGAKSSAWAFATASLLVGLANQYLPAFRTSLGVSGKTALIVSHTVCAGRYRVNIVRSLPARLVDRTCISGPNNQTQ